MATDGISITGGSGHRHVSLDDEGRTVAAADVDSAADPDLVHAVLRREAGPLPGGTGARLVDAVLDLPEVAGAQQLDAAVPATDPDMVQRLRESADDVSTRLAGSTVLVSAHPRVDRSLTLPRSDSGADVDRP